MIFALALNVLAHEIPVSVRFEVDAWKKSVQAQLAESSDFVNSLSGDPARAKDARDFLASLTKPTRKPRYALDFDRDGRLTAKDWALGNRQTSAALFQNQVRHLLAQEDLLKAWTLPEKAEPKEILNHAISLKDRLTPKTVRALQAAGETLLAFQYWGNPSRDDADMERRKALLAAWSPEAFTGDYPDLQEEVAAPDAAKMAQLEGFLRTSKELKLAASEVRLSLVDYMHARDLWIALGQPSTSRMTTELKRGLDGRPAVAAWVRGANPDPDRDNKRAELDAQKKFLKDELRAARAVNDAATAQKLYQALGQIDRQRIELIRASYSGRVGGTPTENQARALEVASAAQLRPAEDTAWKLLVLFSQMPEALRAGSATYSFASAQLR